MQTSDDEDIPLQELLEPEIQMTVKEEQEVSQIGPDDELHEVLPTCSFIESSEPVKPTPSTRQNQLTPPTPSYRADRGKARGRRRSRWKLKFHHQALPPEYLDHYEATIAQSQRDAASLPKVSSSKGRHSSSVKLEPELNDATQQMKNLNTTLLEQLCMPIISAESDVTNRLQDLKIPDEISTNKKRPGARSNCDKFVQGKGLLGSLLSEKEANFEEHKKRLSVITPSPASSKAGKSNAMVHNQSTKVVNYQDLPYMGEITLDNMKPRRGRKPKKADICHLIYKNYGTILQGGPTTQEKEQQSSPPSIAKVKSENVLLNSLRCKAIDSLKNNVQINHTDVQNRIISSLLEKRLTAACQDPRKNALGFPASYLLTKNAESVGHSKRASLEEPLNLCVKDLNQLKIKLLRKHDNFYEPSTSDHAVRVKREYDEIHEVDEEVTAEVGNGSGGVSLQQAIGMPFPMDQPSTSDSGSPSQATLPGGYVYWPNAGVFVHPLALQSQLLYYQKMGSIPLVPGTSTDNSRTLPACSTPNTVSSTKPSKPVTANKLLVPKSFSMLLDPGAKTSVMPSELSFPRMKRLAPSGSLPTMGSPAKRKRSAIFIPPMPTENNANPTTEVSICKFKFTGGAKPSLQEKKMLSVDSGGNFRYYSGTGDKSMRGYEFFPRESLQQTGNATGSSSEQFLTASAMGSGEKIPVQCLSPTETVTKSQSPKDMPSIAEGGSHFFDHQPVNLPQELEVPHFTDAMTGEHFGVREEERDGSQLRLRRKRKTRKSLAREKLEQTFKEKGFLIQTQQLESAEGATYCKFRQLRKFTRYLFRSWKDYLPGNVREMSVAAGVSAPQDSEHEGEHSSNSPQSPQNVSAGTEEPIHQTNLPIS